MMTEQNAERPAILDAIKAELSRQHDLSRAHGLQHLDMDDDRSCRIDGEVDLVALAQAIQSAIR